MYARWIRICTAVCATAVLGMALPARADAPRTGFLLRLSEPAAALTDAGAAKAAPAARTAAVRQQLARIQREQQHLRDALAAKKDAIVELFAVQRVANGIAVLADGAALDDLSALPGVTAVESLTTVHLDNASSVPFLGTPAVWESFGLTGAGVRIGIIDTGIDYLHPDFGGTADPADYAANDTTQLGDVLFPTAKVAGGYDFVGDTYDATDPDRQTPLPDADPMDLHGHGTHVAGTAAGQGVQGDGTAFTGPYDTSTDTANWLVGPGMAPEATLYALKIFGRSGDSLILLPAIEWAVDPNGDGDFSDHLDVINMSLGDNFGPADGPESNAANLAAMAGVIVVAAAGNANDTFFVAGAPGNAPAVISVAATEDADPTNASLVADRLASFSSRGPAQRNEGGPLLKPDVAAPGKQIVSAAAQTVSTASLARTLSGTSMASPHVAGAAALLRQAHPDWPVARIKAALMNTGVAVYREAGERFREGPQRAGAGRIQPLAALTAPAVAYDGLYPDRVSLTFDTGDVAERATESRPVVLENLGQTAITYVADVEALSSIRGASITLEGPLAGTLAPGATATVTLQLHVDAAALRHDRDPATQATFASGSTPFTRAYVSEAAGHVRFSINAGETVLRTPYYGAIRPVADMHADVDRLDARGVDAVSIPLAGTGLQGGDAPPSDIQSLVSAFSVVAVSGVNPALSGLNRAGDVRYLGVGSNFDTVTANGGDIDDVTLSFAFAMDADWSTPHWLKIYVYLDTDQDGTPDFLLDNFVRRVTDPQAGTYPDIFISRLGKFTNMTAVQDNLNYLDYDDFDTRPFMSNVLVLPVRTALLELDESNPTVDFRVEVAMLPGFDIPGQLVLADALPEDRDTMYRYHVDQPGLSFTAGLESQPLYPDLPETTLTAQFHEAGYFANGTLGALLLHHQNGPGARAEFIPVITAGDTDGDGLLDSDEGIADPDGDGLPSLIDTDADGDGILDAVEGTEDPDGDGTPNYLDLDSDGDGLNDAEEAGVYGSDPYLIDTDGDGEADGAEVEAGTDPALAQLPQAPGHVQASDGDVPGAVRITWDAVPGRVSYRVLRAETPNLDDVSHRSTWIEDTQFDDTGAEATVQLPGHGCRAPETRKVVYYYWVQARNPGGEGPVGTPDAGFRADATAVARAGWDMMDSPLTGLLLGMAWIWAGRARRGTRKTGSNEAHAR